VIRTGGNIYQFRSTYGILGSENRQPDQLVAAYRSHLNLHGANIFGGWSKPISFFIYGTLTAVPERDGKGHAIRQKTEGEGFERRFPKPLRARTTTAPTH
jgi:hypothetical protein